MDATSGARRLLPTVVVVGILGAAVGLFVLTSEAPPDTDVKAAVEACDAARVAAILDRGVSATRIEDRSSTEGFLPLATAAGRCGADVVRTLLEGGADPNLGYMGNPPLAEAVLVGDPAVVEALLAGGADPGWVGLEGDSLVARAVTQDHPEILGMLLAAGAPPDVPRVYGGTALFQAAARGEAATVAALLRAGADPNRAATIGLVDLGQFVYSLPVDEQARVVGVLGPAVGLAPDLIAGFVASESEEALANALVLVDAEDITSTLGPVVPLYVATARGDLATVAALVEAGADPTLGFGPGEHSSLAAAEALGRDELAGVLGGEPTP